MKLTISGLERAIHCPASTVLPHVRDVSPSEARDIGSAVHAYLQLVEQIGAAAALLAVPEKYRKICAAIDLDRLPTLNGSMAQEVSFAFNVVTGEGRELRRGDPSRGYVGLDDDEVPGTADAVGVTADKVVIVADYKTGWDAPRAKDSWQLKGYCLAALKTYGCERAIGLIIRVPPMGDPWVDHAEFSEEDLGETELMIASVRERAKLEQVRLDAGKPVAVTRGEHCKYCPAMPMCPAFVGLVGADVVESNVTVAPKRLPPLTRETAPAYLDLVDRLAQVQSWILGGLQVLSKEAPILLPNGKAWGPHPHRRKEFDVQKAWPVLEEVLGPLADRCTTVDIQVGLIKDAVRAHKKKTGAKIGETEKVIYERLRAAGALADKVSYPCSEYKPQDPALPEGEE